MNHGALQVGPSEGHAGYVCATCAGTWLPRKYIASLAYDRQFDPDVFYSMLSKHSAADSSLACPADGALLACARVYDIELDWCRACRGVWFNSNELRELLAHHLRLSSAQAYEFKRWTKKRYGYFEKPSALRRKREKMASIWSVREHSSRASGSGGESCKNAVHLYVGLRELFARTGPINEAGR